MGRRGPAPTPKAILEARGSWRADVAEGTVEFPVAELRPPEWLRADARPLFRALARRLFIQRVSSHPDAQALARYCDLFSAYRRMSAFVEKNGDTLPVKTGSGEVVGVALMPHLKAMRELSVELTRLENQFGFTPAARTRIREGFAGPPPGGADDGKARFLKIG